MNDNDRALEYANGDEEFAAWLREVDEQISQSLGFGLLDLLDMMLQDAYDSGASPETYVQDEVVELVQGEYGREAAELLLVQIER